MMSEQNWFEYAEDRRNSFLSQEINGNYALTQISSDMAPRHYYRVNDAKRNYILLESAPDGHAQALPGHELRAFVEVDRFLESEGFRVPKIHAVNESAGLILMEDFGDMTFERAIANLSEDQKSELYLKATELLVKLRDVPSNKIFSLPSFTGSRIDNGARRFVDWFIPYYLGRSVSDSEIKEFQDMMLAIKSSLPPIESGFVHGDYHPANLMVLEDGELGLLDFQAAMRGPSVYDLTNLLHDARRNVDQDCMYRCQKFYFKDKESGLIHWYNYLSLHFHLRVIGQFLKVALMSGKTNYLQHLDRLREYLDENQNAIFSEYCRNMGLDFSKKLPDLDLERVKGCIRNDAT